MEAQKVVAVRLLSGDEVMGVLVQHPTLGWGGDTIRLKNPASIVVAPPMGPGKPPNIGLAPFAPYFDFKDNIVEFKKDHVVFGPTAADSRLEEGYRKANNMVLTGGAQGLIVP